MLQKMFPKNGSCFPEIRFAGFTNAWEQRELGEVASNFEYGLNASAKEFDGKNKYIRITDIDDESRMFLSDDITSPDTDLTLADRFKLEAGDILFARTGASVGKTYLYREKDGLVYYAGFLIRAKINSENDAEFVFQNTLTDSYNSFIRITSQRSGQPGVNAQEYQGYNFYVPNLEEQKAIGTYFRNLDNLITLHQRKCETLKKLKKSMLQKMFPKNGSCFPEIRFAGFTNAWEQRECGSFATESSEKGHTGSVAKKLTVKLHTNGVYEADEKTQGSDSTQYYVRHTGQFIYGKQNFFNGAIGIVPKNLDKYESTKDVPAFDIDKTIDVEWFYQYMARPEIYKPQEFNCTGTGSKRFHVNSFLGMNIPTPCLEEQHQIGSYFRNLDHLITLHQRKLETLKKLKKAMLQKMFI